VLSFTTTCHTSQVLPPSPCCAQSAVLIRSTQPIRKKHFIKHLKIKKVVERTNASPGRCDNIRQKKTLCQAGQDSDPAIHKVVSDPLAFGRQNLTTRKTGGLSAGLPELISLP
jgi:hypothetical protein